MLLNPQRQPKHRRRKNRVRDLMGDSIPLIDCLVIVGAHRCTWGPAYWCSSLSNARECRSIEHCSSQIWSRQLIEKKVNDNICQYCEYTINKLREILEQKTPEVDSIGI